MDVDPMSFGHDRERAIKKLMEAEDWEVQRAPGSLGIYDLMAAKRGERMRLIEVKATAAGPYHGFGPEDRYRLSRAAYRAGADAYLYWWPKRSKLTVIGEAEWPEDKR